MSYEEIASEEGVTAARIRQIVSEVLQKRAVDSGADSGAGGAGAGTDGSVVAKDAGTAVAALHSQIDAMTSEAAGAAETS